MGEPIPLGDTTLTVLRAERISFANRRYFAIYLRWSGLKPPENAVRNAYLAPEDKAILRLFFADFEVIDDGGNKYPLKDLLPEMYYRYMNTYNAQSLESAWAMMQQMRYDMLKGYPEEWIILFEVPDDAKGLSLRLKNPFCSIWREKSLCPKGQVKEALVPLG